MSEWRTSRVVQELDAPDGRRYAVVELDGACYGICCEGEPIRAVVWPPDRLDDCRSTAQALASGRRTAGETVPASKLAPADD